MKITRVIWRDKNEWNNRKEKSQLFKFLEILVYAVIMIILVMIGYFINYDKISIVKSLIVTLSLLIALSLGVLLEKWSIKYKW